jgi:hypothetical protein
MNARKTNTFYLSIMIVALLLTGVTSMAQESLVNARELFRDTAFAEGFGASWSYGSKFTLSSERKEGAVTAYR